MNEQFTLEGRRILEEKTNGGELQQLIDYVHGPIWICTCGKRGCQHLDATRMDVVPVCKRFRILGVLFYKLTAVSWREVSKLFRRK